MQIISELEQTCRNAYAGALGLFWVEETTTLVLQLELRFLKNKNIYLQTGAGIVADSEPDMEFYETINKAKGMLSAACLAQKMGN